VTVIAFPTPDPEPELLTGTCSRCGRRTTRGRPWREEVGTCPIPGGIVHADPAECGPLPPQYHEQPA
jgi:hypothetical protein